MRRNNFNLDAIKKSPVSNQMKNYRYIIGIDTGTRTGFAMWSKVSSALLVCEDMPIHKAMLKLTELHDDKELLFVRVEDARLRKWIPQEKNITQRIGRAKGAGSVSRDAKIWEDFLTDLGVAFELVPPKNNKTKVDASYFKKISGWQGKTNEHSRDAAMLVIGY